MLQAPGPASTVGDRPPTNPAIRVRLPSEADGNSFSPCLNVHILCRTPIYRTSFQRKSESAIYWTMKAVVTSLLYEKGT